MNVYLYALEEDLSSDEVKRWKDVVKGNDVYAIREGVFLLRTVMESVKDVGAVFAALDGPKAGVIFKIGGSYAGFYDEDLWDWLRASHEVPA